MARSDPMEILQTKDLNRFLREVNEALALNTRFPQSRSQKHENNFRVYKTVNVADQLKQSYLERVDRETRELNKTNYI